MRVAYSGGEKSCESHVKVWRGATENAPLNAGQRPHFRDVRVSLGMGYNPVEGNRWASRNGRASDLAPEIPHVTIRNFVIAVVRGVARRRCVLVMWNALCQ
jgi:hypothetical protein